MAIETLSHVGRLNHHPTESEFHHSTHRCHVRACLEAVQRPASKIPPQVESLQDAWTAGDRSRPRRHRHQDHKNMERAVTHQHEYRSHQLAMLPIGNTSLQRLAAARCLFRSTRQRLSPAAGSTEVPLSRPREAAPRYHRCMWFPLQVTIGCHAEQHDGCPPPKQPPATSEPDRPTLDNRLPLAATVLDR